MYGGARTSFFLLDETALPESYYFFHRRRNRSIMINVDRIVILFTRTHNFLRGFRGRERIVYRRGDRVQEHEEEEEKKWHIIPVRTTRTAELARDYGSGVLLIITRFGWKGNFLVNDEKAQSIRLRRRVTVTRNIIINVYILH